MVLMLLVFFSFLSLLHFGMTRFIHKDVNQHVIFALEISNGVAIRFLRVCRI